MGSAAYAIASNTENTNSGKTTKSGQQKNPAFHVDIMGRNRDTANKYWQKRRLQSKQARIVAENKLVDANELLASPRFLRQIKSYIEMGGTFYARKALSDAGVAKQEDIERIISKAMES